VTSKFLEISVRSDKRSLLHNRQGGRDTIDVGNFVNGFDLTSFESLSKIDGHYLDRKARETSERAMSFFFAATLPQQIEDLTPIQNGDRRSRALLVRFMENFPYTLCSRTCIQEVKQCVGIEDVPFHRFSIR
jgi:hypothetical protein